MSAHNEYGDDDVFGSPIVIEQDGLLPEHFGSGQFRMDHALLRKASDELRFARGHDLDTEEDPCGEDPRQ